MTGAAAGTALHERFVRHLASSRLLHDRSQLLVALSGGLDSVVLLHLLRFTDSSRRITAAHLDHAMRSGSAQDAEWVRGLCLSWDIPLITERTASALCSEAAARDARYAFLCRAAAAAGADAILTAHHADDQAETVLFRIMRGTGVAGLRGILPKRGAIVRPLLPFQRAELERYARAVRLDWRADPTNAELRYARNRIRHQVLPVLEAMQPGAARRIAQLAARAAASEAAWQHVVDAAAADAVTRRMEDGFALARGRLLAYHPHVRARVLRHLLRQLGSRPGRTGTRFAMKFIRSGESGGSIRLSGGVRLGREFDELLLRVVTPQQPHSDVALRIPGVDAGAGSFMSGGRSHTVSWGPDRSDAGSACTAAFDPSSLRFPLELRGWRPGDRVRLAYGSKKLKKLFQEQRIGRSARASVPVLADAAGRVLWVPGVAQSVEAAPGGAAAFHITVADGDTF